MSGVPARLAGLFVGPAEEEPGETWALPPAVRAVVVGPLADAGPLAAALALSLRAADGAPAAVVASWRSDRGREAVRPAAAVRGATRLAARLAELGPAAVARGRLVWLTLPTDPAAAAAVVHRASAVVNGPFVTALGGARPPDLDGLVAEHDLAVVAADPASALARAAVARWAERGVAASARAPLGRGLPRALALAGVAAGRNDAPAVAAGRVDPPRRRPTGARGQASVLLVAGLAAVLVGALVLGSVTRGVAREAAAQRAADLAALAGARAMHEANPRLFEPAVVDGHVNPRHLTRAAYLTRAAEAAERTGRVNGADEIAVRFPDGDSFAPVRIRVDVRDVVEVRRGEQRRSVPIAVTAEAELAPAIEAFVAGGGYDGPLAYRQGKPMRPDVALAFDRLEREARAAGVSLLITSAFRSDAEQAELFRRNPDPKWVAPPGRSLHRNATELDLGPPAAYPWLAANAERFHFVQRYAWEPWHYGYTLNPRSTPRPVGGAAAGGDGSHHHAGLPSFVPARFAPIITRAAQRWNVSAALLAAQLYAESNFNPFARSGAGAQGIAQFMPATARALGLDNPFDAAQAIDAQAHLMRDLLRRFASVPLALAAYNAGEGAVAGCMCVPPFAETRGYVARILGLLGGAGEAVPAAGLSVRLVR